MRGGLSAHPSQELKLGTRAANSLDGEQVTDVTSTVCSSRRCDLPIIVSDAGCIQACGQVKLETGCQGRSAVNALTHEIDTPTEWVVPNGRSTMG